jgi:hypothetical protein
MQIFELHICKPAKLLRNLENFYFANLLVGHSADYISHFFHIVALQYLQHNFVQIKVQNTFVELLIIK